MKSVTIKTEEGHEVRVSADERGMCILTCVTSAGTVAYKLPAWVVLALMRKRADADERACCPHAGQCCCEAGHSGPHTSSPDEARRLDAVVTHEDLRKLKLEILDGLAELMREAP